MPAGGKCYVHPMARDPDTTARPPRTDEAERYRTAALTALDQLDWCIAYLRRINKSSIAAALSRNRSDIRKRLL